MIKVTSAKGFSFVFIVLILVNGCAFFGKNSTPLRWTGQIESYAPGAEIPDESIVTVEVNQPLPEGLTGPNPKGADAGVISKVIQAIPGLEAPVTSSTPVQMVESEEQPSIAQGDSTGWVWDDRVQKWKLTANRIPQTDQWIYEPEALLVRVTAQDYLNVFDGVNHATVVKVIQLDNPKMFNQLRQDSYGIGDMLTKTALDSSFIAEKQLFLLPGDNRILKFDREEGVKYVGILTGYYGLDQHKVVSRLVKIPAVIESLDTGLLTKYWPLKKANVIQRPARLKVWIELGEFQIENMAIQVN